jgi:hypothetical protein
VVSRGKFVAVRFGALVTLVALRRGGAGLFEAFGPELDPPLVAL